MYCKYCGKKIKEGEVCDCQKQPDRDPKKDEKKRQRGGISRKLAAVIILGAVLLAGAVILVTAFSPGIKANEESEEEQSGTEEAGKDEAERDRTGKDKADKAGKDESEKDKDTENKLEENVRENNQISEENDKSKAEESEFARIKADYDNKILDYEGAKKALDGMDTDKISEDEIDQVIAFQEQLETDHEQQTAQVFSMSAVSSVSATSSLSEYDMTHSPDRVTDGDLTTAWVEGANGQGEGESLILTFDGTYEVSGVVVNGGYQKSSDLYYKNSRPASVKVTCSDGTSQVYEMSDTFGEQIIQFTSPVKTESLTFTIQSVYPGNKYEDTAFSEISVF